LAATQIDLGTALEGGNGEMLKIGIIVGSTRPGRKAAAVSKWVHDLLKNRNDAEFEIVDIEDYKLPLLDEPVPPHHASIR
jgi:NAD(P)H-dependent FMN reductase